MPRSLLSSRASRCCNTSTMAWSAPTDSFERNRSRLCSAAAEAPTPTISGDFLCRPPSASRDWLGSFIRREAFVPFDFRDCYKRLQTLQRWKIALNRQNDVAMQTVEAGLGPVALVVRRAAKVHTDHMLDIGHNSTSEELNALSRRAQAATERARALIDENERWQQHALRQLEYLFELGAEFRRPRRIAYPPERRP